MPSPCSTSHQVPGTGRFAAWGVKSARYFLCAMTPSIPPVCVDDVTCAAALGVSVSWLRKDRRLQRRVPFYRLGGRILYNLDRVREALAEVEEGGPAQRKGRR